MRGRVVISGVDAVGHILLVETEGVGTAASDDLWLQW